MAKRIFSEAFWLIVAIGIVAGGWFGFQYLGAERIVVEAADVEIAVPVVDVTDLTRADGGIPIRSGGFLRAARSLDLAAQTGGRIVDLHPSIEARDTFSRGDVLFRLDDRNARASIDQIRANIESTQAQQDLIGKQLARARSLHERGVISQDQRDQLETQSEEIAASQRSLQANLEAAEVALTHTAVTAPFDGRVLEKRADLGAVITQGTAVARIYSADDIEVEIAIREDEAALIPSLFEAPAAAARVETQFAGNSYGWDATIARVDRQIDMQTRTIDVTLRLVDPAQGRPVVGSGPAIPALINAYVTAEINATPKEQVYVADATAIKGNADIWLAVDDRLIVHPVDVLHRDGTVVYFAPGELPENARLVTSQLAIVTDGMRINTASQTVALDDGDQ